MITPDTPSVILMFLTALTAGLVGSFALMKRMALAGDAISHIALPGLGLALLFKINPIIGGAAALLIGTFLIWKIGEKTGLATETTIGVIFSASLALGALVTPSEDLIEALFGGSLSISSLEFFIYLAIALLVLWFLLAYKNKLILGLFSPDLALTTGMNLPRLNLFYLIIFSLTVILGLKFLGALLVGSLIIIPAAVGRQLTHQFTSFLTISAIVSVLSVILGLFISRAYGIELGPTVVSVAAGFFFLSLVKKKR